MNRIIKQNSKTICGLSIFAILAIIVLHNKITEMNDLKDQVLREQRIKKIALKMNTPKTPDNFFGNNCEEYRRNCLNLFFKLRFPNENLVFRPAKKEIPKELYQQFTQYGDLPLTKYWYFNEVFNDADSEKRSKKDPVSVDQFNSYREKVRNWQPLGYENTNFHVIFDKFKSRIADRSMVVIGTISPWIEAMSYEMNASRIITLDYTRKYWHDPKLEWYHVNDYLEDALAGDMVGQLDNAATYSSIEHSGLGRFGDPLSPDGDIDAMKQVHCMLKPKGLFFLGDLQNTDSDKGELKFNAMRSYGRKRLKMLFEGWSLVERPAKKEFVLEKVGKC